MSGASASSGSSTLGSSSSSPGGGSVSYTGSGGFSSSTSDASPYSSASSTSNSTASSFDLSQISFSSRSEINGSIQGSERGAEVSEMFSRLALPARPTLSFQERSQDTAYSKRASENGIAGLVVAMGSRSTSEIMGAGRGGRTGAVLAEGSQQESETKGSQEKDVRAEERRAPGDVPAAVLEGNSFSVRLRQWRGERQAEPIEKLAGENKAQDLKTPDDKEERLTQYYRRVLDSLVESNMITEDMASSARGKRGNELVTAIGVALSQAEEQKTLASRSRTQEMGRQAIARQRAISAQAD